MSFCRGLAAMVLTLATGCRSTRPARPSVAFADYSAPIDTAIRLQRLDLGSDTLLMRWAADLQPAVGAPPNFAGHFIIRQWPAGFPVGQLLAVIDARTGRAWLTKADPMVGAEFQVSSALLVVDPPALVHQRLDDTSARLADLRALAWTRYYRWNGDRLVALDSGKVYSGP